MFRFPWRVSRAYVPVVVLFTIGLAGFAPIVTAFAQATPPAGEVIPGSECTAPARPVDFLAVLVQTPVPDDNYVPPAAVPEGTPPDPRVTAEITEAVRQIIACSNTGEALRALSLFSDEYLRRSVDPKGDMTPRVALDLIAPLATPIPMKESELIRLIGISQIVQMADGRVAVVVESDPDSKDAAHDTDIDLFIFAKLDDRWIVVDAKRDIDQT